MEEHSITIILNLILSKCYFDNGFDENEEVINVEKDEDGDIILILAVIK